MPALNPSTPRREAVRAVLVAAAAFAGGCLWVLADAAARVPVGPLAAFAMPDAAIAPRAWALDVATWHGLARLAFTVQESGLAWVLRLAALALGIAATVAVIHPGAFRRPSPYYLTPLRRAAAYVSAVAIGYGMPGVLAALGDALTPDLTTTTYLDLGAALRLAGVLALVGAAIWTVAGPGLYNIRALLRFSHGALAGLAVWAACALAVLLAAPLRDLGALASVGNVMVAVDAGRGAPGATFGAVLTATALVYGAGLALAGALAVIGAPQSMGARSRSGAAVVGAALLLLLLGLGWSTARGTARRVAEAAPDLVATLGLSPTAPPRPVVLLLGEGAAARRVPPRQALAPLRLAPDCAPAPAWGEVRLPAASDENLAKLDAWQAAHRSEVSGLAARVAGCRVAILARLFRPAEARAQVFGETEPARIGIFALSFALRGLGEGPATADGARWLDSVADTARWAATAEGRERLARWRARPRAVEGEVRGRLDAPDAARWRVALAVGAAAGSGLDPYLLAPRTDGQVLLGVAQAVQPLADGSFAFRGVAPGWYQLALLAPAGTEPNRLFALSVRNDPGQFSIAAGPVRRDLGTIHLSFQPPSTIRPRSETP
jgi:hypothetical protein